MRNPRVNLTRYHVAVSPYLQGANSRTTPYHIIHIVLYLSPQLIRYEISKQLIQAWDIRVVGETENEGEAIRMVQELTPEVLIIDLTHPREETAQVLRLISEKQLPVKIIALGATETRQQVEQLYKSGVDKYLETDSSLSDLIGVIRLAAGTVR